MSEIPLWLQSPPPNLKLDQFKLPLYPFQNSGAIFLAQNPNSLLRDSVGLGKCPQSLAAFNALVRKQPTLKCLIVVPASLIHQWKDEIEKFTTFKSIIYRGQKKTRDNIMKTFIRDPEIQCLITNYEIVRRDEDNFLDLHREFPYIIIFDEAQKIKNHRSKTAQAIKLLSMRSSGNKLLTATPVFNNVLDLYGLFKIINPAVFGTYVNFMNNFTNYYMMDMGSYQIPVYQGPKNIPLLKDKIKGYVFGREKKDVYNQLPPLTFSDRFVALPEHHQEIYDALEQEKLIVDDVETKDIDRLAALTHMQSCADAVEHLNTTVAPSHPKIDECIQIIEEEFDDDKIIVYSKFTRTIDILNAELKKKNIAHFNIDGRIDAAQRDANKKAWENHPGKAILVISSAGGAGLNLQAAGTIIFLNRPWSYGELLQVCGRIHRIGTKHEKLLIINLYCEGTIDEDIRDTLKSKEAVFNRLFIQGGENLAEKDFSREIWNKAYQRATAKI